MIFSVFCVIVSCMGMFISCDNSEKLTSDEVLRNEEQVDESFQDLSYQLECYNKKIQENRVETRSLWGWLKRVGKADALGAIAGGGLGFGSSTIHGSSWGDRGRVSLFGALFVGVCNSVEGI